jgi:hypothetical protein
MNLWKITLFSWDKPKPQWKWDWKIIKNFLGGDYQ